MVGFFDDDFKKLLAMSAARDVGGLMNQWGGGQGQVGPDPVALWGMKQQMAEQQRKDAALQNVQSAMFPEDPNAPPTMAGGSPVGGAAAAGGLLGGGGEPAQTGFFQDPKFMQSLWEYDPDMALKFAMEQQQGRDPLSASDLVKVQTPDGRITYLPADQASGMTPAQDPYTLGPGSGRYQGDDLLAQQPFKPDALSPERFQQDLKLREAGRPSVQVNTGPTGIDYGDPEKGLVWARTPDGKVKLDERGAPIGVPYQGGSIYRETQAAEEAKVTRRKEQTTYADVVVQDVDRVKKLVKEGGILGTPITGVTSFQSAVPGTNAYDAKAMLDTIRANVGFNRLQQMRDSSPTGGALGQVSELENRLMQSTLGNLELSQSEDQFLKNLDRVQDVYLDIIHGKGKRPQGNQTRYAGMTEADLMTVDPATLEGTDLDEYIKALEAVVGQ